MNPTTRISLFVGLYAVVFIGAMGVITNGVMDIAAAASAPVILCAEAIVFSMLYMTFFHGEHHEDQAPAITKQSVSEMFAKKSENALQH